MDKCYICLVEEGKLVRPCTNEKCTARTHEVCLSEQYEKGNKRCGSCRNEIIMIYSGEIDISRCCENYMKCAYLAFLSIVVHPLLVVLIMGNSLVDETIVLPMPSNRTWYDAIKTFLYIIMIVIGIISWMIVTPSYIFGKISLDRKYSIATKIYSSLYLLSILCQSVGYFVTGENYTIISFVYGLLLTLFLFLFVGLCVWIYYYTRKEFSKAKKYGIAIN